VQTTTDAQTRAIVAATTAFLGSLNAAQREKVQFIFTPQKDGHRGQISGRYERSDDFCRRAVRPFRLVELPDQ
jgi:hypothetical protein